MKYLYLSLSIFLISGCVQTKNKTESRIERTENPNKHFCTSEYRPVCAEVEIQCVTTPCDAIKKTFSNRCVMRNTPHATFLHEGVCKK